MTPYAPFVMMARPAKVTIADYWTAWTGVDESKVGTVDIVSFVRDSLFRYNEVTDILSCINQEKSFLFDKVNQILYVHFEHNELIFTGLYSYGIYYGFSSKSVVYIDDIEYLPVIKNNPKINQSQDFSGYKKLTFNKTNLELNNLDGQFDSMIDLNIYGNTVKILYIEDSQIQNDNVYTGAITPLSTFYIDKYSPGLQSIKFVLQDMRKSMSVKIPRNLYTSTQYPNIEDSVKSKVIPFLWGQVREAAALPTNGKLTSSNIVFRVAEILTSLGTVWFLDNEIWTQKTPLSVDLPNGSFTMLSSACRNASGGILKCKVINPIGIVINYTSDIIVDINERFLGVPFTSSNYDRDEWTREESRLSTGGYLLDSQKDSYDAICDVQNGSILGFRYEFNFDGKRTIRIDDFDRPVNRIINNVDIFNINQLEVENDTSYVFGEIKVNYSNSYYDKSKFSIIDSSNLESVKNKFKKQDQGEFDTILISEELSIIRAANDAEKYKDVRPILQLELFGFEFFDLRIYDIVDIEITGGFVDLENNTITGRKFYGIKRCQILGINPDENTGVNTIDFVIIRDYDYDTLELTNDGDYIITNDGFNIAYNK